MPKTILLPPVPAKPAGAPRSPWTPTLRGLRAAALDRLCRRTDVWVARTGAERDALARLRYRIYAHEQGDAGGVVDREAERFLAPGDADPNTLHIGCGPRTAPVGSVRVQTWEPGQVPPVYAAQHAIHRFPGVERMRISHVVYLMVDPSLRGARDTLGFVMAAMELAGQEAGPGMVFAHAAPGLVQRYRELGLRPYGAAPFGSTRGLEIPLALVPEPTWLRRSGCLWGPAILRLVRGGFVPQPPRSRLAPFERPGLTGEPAALHAAWRASGTHALSGLGADATGAIVSRGLLLDVPAGVELMVEGFGETDPQLLLRGAVEVEVGGRRIGGQAAGALLGADEWLDRTGRRRATVRTTAPSTILNIRARSLRRRCMRGDAVARELLAAFSAAAGQREAA